MIKVIDAAVAKAYGGKKKIHWMEVYAGEKSTQIYGPTSGCRRKPSTRSSEYSVSIKGPMTTPVGGGIRSLNVALRQELDLYQCLRARCATSGRAQPAQGAREDTDMVIFRENTEDIYAGIEWQAGAEGAKKVIKFLRGDGRQEDPLPGRPGIGIKPVSRGHRAPRARAIQYAIDNDRKSVTLVHKGNIMKFTEGLSATGATSWRRRSSAPTADRRRPVVQVQEPEDGREIVIKDAIADAFLQQILLRRPSTT